MVAFWTNFFLEISYESARVNTNSFPPPREAYRVLIPRAILLLPRETLLAFL